MSESIDKIIKVVASIFLVGAILFFVIPSIFGIVLKSLVDLISLFLYLCFGYIIVKGLESIWAPSKKV